MARDQETAGKARITKTKRVSHSITAGDLAAFTLLLDVPWDIPFVDTNYTSDQNVEVVPPALPANYFIAGFVKFADKISVQLEIGSGNVGDVIVMHAIAIHD